MLKVISAIDDCSFDKSDNVVTALGFFDGLHLAHRRIVEECKRRARARNGLCVVFTFQNHPSSILTPDFSTHLLTPYPLKLKLLEAMEVDVVIGVPFDMTFSHTEAENFIDRILCEKLKTHEIVVGYDFHFGRERKGTAALLQSYVPSEFDEVTVIEQMRLENDTISSTNIRRSIQLGELDRAANLLGRPYQLYGQVTEGDGRGREIGFPTANLNTSGQILPPKGVYGVRFRKESINAHGEWGVMNVGTIPTFKEGEQLSVEIHLLDSNENLYGITAIVDILQFIRPEQKFPNPNALIAQIHSDIQTFRDWIEIHDGK